MFIPGIKLLLVSECLMLATLASSEMLPEPGKPPAATNGPPPAAVVEYAGTNRPPAATEQSGQTAGKKIKRWADHTHEYINRNFILYAKKTDRWLSANDLALEESDVSRLRLSLTTQYMDEEFSFHPACKLRLAIPYTQRRYQIILDRFSNETMPAGERDFNDRRDRTDNRTQVGMRFVDIVSTNISRHLDVGFSFPNVIPYVRANASWSSPWGPWTPRLTGQISWERDDGFGAKSPFEIQRELVPRLWLKSYTEASWLESEAGIYFVQDFSLHWLRTDWDAVSPLFEITTRSHPYDYDANGYDHPDNFIERAWFSIRYRRQIYKDWLYLEFEPGVYASREFDFKTEPVIRLKFEAVFGATVFTRDDLTDQLLPDL